MSGMSEDYREHLEAGLQPHGVRERYYFVARPGQPYNRLVDISSTVEEKIAAIVECRSKGGGNSGSMLRSRLAREGKRLPVLGDDDQTADREYVRRFLLGENRRLGAQHGVSYAEAFYYTAQRIPDEKSELEEYIKENAVPL